MLTGDVAGVDSYDLDATVDGRGSKGALHLYNKFHIENPSNMFVVEYPRVQTWPRSSTRMC